MSVELALYIGSMWKQDENPAYLEAFTDFNRKYGRSIQQVAYVDLTTVHRGMWDLVEHHQKLANEEFERSGVFWHITTSVQENGEEKNLVEDSYGMRIPCIPLEEVRDAIVAFEGWERRPQLVLAMAIINAYLAEFQGGIYGKPVALAYGH